MMLFVGFGIAAFLILFFASLAQHLGTQETSLELSDGATVSDALSALEKQFERLLEMRDSLATAVEMEYVSADHVLHDGDELALIPPVSGG